MSNNNGGRVPGATRGHTLAAKRAQARQTAMTLLTLELLETQLLRRMPAAVEAEILALDLLERLRTTR